MTLMMMAEVVRCRTQNLTELLIAVVNLKLKLMSLPSCVIEPELILMSLPSGS